MGKPRSEHPDLAQVVSRDREVHSGDLVFAGTRVPVDTLIDYLEGGDSVEQFLEDFPTVERWQVEAFLRTSAPRSAFSD